MNFTVKVKIIGGFSILAILLVTTSLFSFSNLSTISNSTKKVSQLAIPTLQESNELKIELVMMSNLAVKSYYQDDLTSLAGFEKRLGDENTKFSNTLKKLKGVVKNEANLLTNLNKVDDVYKSFIDNQWIEASDGARMPVQNPATGEAWAEVPACGAAEAHRALESSQRAQTEWQLLSPVERAAYIYKITAGIEAERDLFEELLVKEQGKPRAEGVGEVERERCGDVLVRNLVDHRLSATHQHGELIGDDGRLKAQRADERSNGGRCAHFAQVAVARGHV